MPTPPLRAAALAALMLSLAASAHAVWNGQSYNTGGQGVQTGANESGDYGLPGPDSDRIGARVHTGAPNVPGTGVGTVTTTLPAVPGSETTVDDALQRTHNNKPKPTPGSSPGSGPSTPPSNPPTPPTPDNNGGKPSGPPSDDSPVQNSYPPCSTYFGLQLNPGGCAHSDQGQPAGGAAREGTLSPGSEAGAGDHWLGRSGAEGPARAGSTAGAAVGPDGQVSAADAWQPGQSAPAAYGDAELASPALMRPRMVHGQGQDLSAAAAPSRPRVVEAAVVAPFERMASLFGAKPAPAPAAAAGGSRAAGPVVASGGLLVDINAIEADLRWAGKLHNYQQVVDEATAYLKLAKPDDARALLALAEALNHLKRYKEAEEAARRALKVDPKSWRAWLNLASAEAGQKRYAEALEAVNQAITLDPKQAASYLIRAKILQSLGRTEDALADMKRAAELDARFRPRYEAALKAGRVPTDEDTTLGEEDSFPGAGGLPLWLLVSAAGLIVFLGTLALVLRDGKGLSVFRRASGPYAAPAAPAAPSGGLKAKYDLKGIVGRGGMGEVWQALDRSLARPVAVKHMSKAVEELGPRGRELFIKEARTVAALHHPNIVDIYEIIEDGPELYLVFEYVDGRTVSHVLAERGRLSLDEATRILEPVCSALEFAHSRKLVHRDLKPANIMLANHGFVKLMDFGIARSLTDASPQPMGPTRPRSGRTPLLIARTTHVAGTPSYMALEAEGGVVRKESDIYSLGVCLYEMLTGRLPFGPEAAVDARLAGRFPRASEVVAGLPLAVDALLKDSLEGDPDKRLSSAREFAARLKGAHA